jgi:hypothetical protein
MRIKLIRKPLSPEVKNVINRPVLLDSWSTPIANRRRQGRVD